MQTKIDLRTKPLQSKKKTFFLRQVQEELKKVTWTTKDELKTCTKIVVGTIVFLGLGIYLADVIIQVSLQLISSFAKFIGG